MSTGEILCLICRKNKIDEGLIEGSDESDDNDDDDVDGRGDERAFVLTPARHANPTTNDLSNPTPEPQRPNTTITSKAQPTKTDRSPKTRAERHLAGITPEKSTESKQN